MTSRTRSSLAYSNKQNVNLKEKYDLKFCVICCSEDKSDFENASLLGRNLAVIFFMRKVLQVPDYQLEEYLREYGDPGNWIRLCNDCSQLTRQAEELYWNILKIERELKTVQHLIVEKVKSSSSAVPYSRLERKSVWKKTREFAREKCEPITVTNPFIEGDKLAKYLISQQRSAVSLVLLPNKQGNLETEPCDLEQICIETGSTPPNVKLEVDAKAGDDDDWIEEGIDDEKWADDLEMEVKLETTIEEDDQENSSGRIVDGMNWTNRDVPRVSKLRSLGLGSSVSMLRKRRNQKMIRINGKLKCRYCDKLFGAMSTCLLHEKEKHPRIPGQFPCEICGKTWNSRDYLRDHRRSVHGITPNGIQVISKKKLENLRKKSKTSPNLIGVGKNQKKAEKIDGKWKCRHCDQMFGAASSCYLHEREKHSSKPGGYICEICGKAWNSQDYLRDHRRRIHGVNPDGSRVILIRKRKREKIEKLDGENEKKARKNLKRTTSSLRAKSVKKVKKIKIKMELIDGKWKCRHCDQLFAAKSSCYLHEREKHADKPGEYICDICGKTWNSRDYLRDHRRSTHGLNPDGSKVEKGKPEPKIKFKKEKTKCDYCEKVFTCQRTCYLHEQEKHAESKPSGQIICDICGESWNTRHYFRKHRRSKHKINADGTPVPK